MNFIPLYLFCYTSALYYIGTIIEGTRAGGTTFPFIDFNGNIRAIQVKQFDPGNHTISTDFLHSIIRRNLLKQGKTLPQWLEAYQNQGKKVSCLFGAHLLKKYPSNPVGLVEAPKTALYCTLYFGFPYESENLLWLAVYNLSSLNYEKCKSLEGREVYLFPDLSLNGKAFNLWNEKAKELERLIPGSRFFASDFLERYASETDRSNGLDLADFLINLDWQDFRNNPCDQEKISNNVPVELDKPTLIHEKHVGLKKTFFEDSTTREYDTSTASNFVPENPQYVNWDIGQLESFYQNIELPKYPVQLNRASEIVNADRFVKSHLEILKSNPGKPIFLPFYKRLYEFMGLIKSDKL